MRTTASLIGITAFLAIVPSAAAEPFGSIHVTANRNQYVGRGCPIEILFSGTINFEMPHPKGFVFNYQWERSDGAKGPVRVVRPAPNERSLVVRDKWRLGAPGRNLDVSQTLLVNSGNTHLSQSSQTVRVECR
jgi:hypothetical protein